ncbi:MAG: SseB family protein [Canibacter sp.]
MAIRKLPSTGDKPRNSFSPTGLPDGVHSGGEGDSAGFTWAGRTFEHHDTAFADDDGSTPASYAQAVVRLREANRFLREAPDKLAELGADTVLEHIATAHGQVLVSLSKIRLLVPLVADAGDMGFTPDGKPVEKTQELSIVTVQAPDGRTVMPVFTSVAAMQAWDGTARPIPVPGPQAALAAAQEGTDMLIVDPGASATEFGVRTTELQAVALGQARQPAWLQTALIDAFARAAEPEESVHTVQLLPGDGEARLRAPEVDVVLRVATGLSKEALAALISRLQENWAQHPAIGTEVDSLRVRVLPSDH